MNEAVPDNALGIGPDFRPDWRRVAGIDGGQDNHLFVLPSVTADAGSGGIRSVGQAHAASNPTTLRRLG